jgi:hypothetical protein
MYPYLWQRQGEQLGHRVYSNHRAMYGTYPATRTFIRVNVAGVVDQRNSKIAWVALNGFYLTICDQVYV